MNEGRGQTQEKEQIFKLKAPYTPTGDQPQAIAELVRGLQGGQSVRRLCSGLPVPVRPLRWPMSSSS